MTHISRRTTLAHSLSLTLTDQALGMAYGFSECVIEKYRAKSDMNNAIYAGCITGAFLSRSGPPPAHTARAPQTRNYPDACPRSRNGNHVCVCVRVCSGTDGHAMGGWGLRGMVIRDGMFFALGLHGWIFLRWWSQ